MIRAAGIATRRRAVEIATAALAAAAGAGLLALAVPMAGAGLAETPGNAILARLHLGAPDRDRLRRLAATREASLAWRGKGRTATDLALARMMLARAAGDAGERARHVAGAREALVAGLGLAPMNPYGWIRLVRIGMEAGHRPEEIAPALGFAMHTGPRERRLRMLVAEAGLYAWRALDPTDRAAVAGRVRRAWRENALRTAAAAARAGRTALLARLVGLAAPGPGAIPQPAPDPDPDPVPDPDPDPDPAPDPDPR